MVLSRSIYEGEIWFRWLPGCVHEHDANKQSADEKAFLLSKRRKGNFLYLNIICCEPFVWVLCILLLGSLLVYRFRIEEGSSIQNCFGDTAFVRRTTWSNIRTHTNASDAVEMSRTLRFDSVARDFQYRYDGRGRTLPANMSKISLDFEVEIFGTLIVMTPSLLLMRGGLNPLVGRQHNSSSIFPNISKWFSIGLDGKLGKSTTAYVELQTVTAHPSEFSVGPILPELQGWLDRLLVCKTGPCTLGYGALGPIQYLSEGDHWAGIQFTIGLPLSHVPKLLELTAKTNTAVEADLARTEVVCSTKASVCSDSYRGLLLLAARLISIASTSNHSHSKRPPKRQMKPWLVRTHFGDLARLGGARPYELEHLTADALFVAELQPDALLWPGGFMDYLRFPEMAEISGLVRARDKTYEREEPIPELATDLVGLEEQASKMLNRSTCVDRRLAVRPNLQPDEFTAKEWLGQVAVGRDLMSDWDSPISAHDSHSHLLWKSMGQWRMRPGDNRVYLECYNEKVSCLPIDQRMTFPLGDAADVERAMRSVARVVNDLAVASS